MKHVRIYEHYNEIDVDDNYKQSDEELIQYFIETFYNGQFKQLRDILFALCDRGSYIISELIEVVSNDTKSDEIKNWIIMRLAEEVVTI